MASASPAPGSGDTPFNLDGALRQVNNIRSLSKLWDDLPGDQIKSDAIVNKLIGKTVEIIQKELATEIDTIDPERIKILHHIEDRVSDLAFNKGIFRGAKRRVGAAGPVNVTSSSKKLLTHLDKELKEVLKVLEEPDKLQIQLTEEKDPKKLLAFGRKLLKLTQVAGFSIGILNHWGIKFLNRASELLMQKGASNPTKERSYMLQAMKIRTEIANLKMDPENPISWATFNMAFAESVEHPMLGTCNFGCALSGVDSQAVKGTILQAREITVDGVKKQEFTCKTSQSKADNIRESILQASMDPAIREELRSSGICEGLSCYNDFYRYRKKDPTTGEFVTDRENEFANMGRCLRIELKGLATIEIGSDPDFVSMYNRVIISVKPDADPKDIQKALAVIGLSDITARSTDYDIQKFKINSLLHYYYPRLATELEDDPNFLDMPIAKLEDLINSKDPKIWKHIMRELPNIEFQEISPGEKVLCIRGEGARLRREGVRGFYAGFGGDIGNSAGIIASVVQSGAFSSQVRFEQGMLLGGASSRDDHRMGSADRVFTRMAYGSRPPDFTSPPAGVDGSQGQPISVSPFAGNFQLLLSTDLAEMKPYCYASDAYGCRRRGHVMSTGESYDTRPSLPELAETSRRSWRPDNEVMFKRRIPPGFIKGISYQDPRKDLIRVIEGHPKYSFPVGITTEADKLRFISTPTHAEGSAIDILENIVIDEAVAVFENEGLYPPIMTTEAEKKEYVLSHIAELKILQRRKPHLNLEIPGEGRYRGKSIARHWVADPRSDLVTELQKLGYTDNVNGIPLDEFIVERNRFDDSMFERC